MRKLSSWILIAVLLMSAVVAAPTAGLAADAIHKEPDAREISEMSAEEFKDEPTVCADREGQNKAQKESAKVEFSTLQAKHYVQQLLPEGVPPINLNLRIASDLMPAQSVKSLLARVGAGLYAGFAQGGSLRSALQGGTLFGAVRAMFAAIPASDESHAGLKSEEMAGVDERGYIRIPLELLADAEDQDEAIMQEMIELLPQSPGMSAILCAILDNGRAENHTGAREVFGSVMRSRAMIAEAVRMTEEEPEVFMKAQGVARSILETSSVSFARVQTRGDGRIQWWDGQNTNVPGEIYKTLRVEHTTFTSNQTRVAHLRYYTDDECLYIMGALRNCRVLNRDWDLLAPEV